MDPVKNDADASILLRKAELLSELIDGDAEYFCSRSGRLALAAGERLFSSGSKADRFYVVESGEIAIVREGDVIARFGPKDVIGDFDFARGALRDAEARIERDARLVVFPAEGLDLGDLVDERPDASARLLLRSITMISSRLRSVQRLISENDPWVRELRRQSWTDPTTGLYTKIFLDEELPHRLEEPSLFLLIKPDRFKDLVDLHGHAAGDAAMGAVARILHEEVEGSGKGWAVRIKSNETALILPRSSDDEALVVARRIAQAFDRIDISKTIGGHPFKFSVSQALGFWPRNETDPKRLFDGVYGVLMRAWRDGGARVYRMRSKAGGPLEGGEDRRRGFEPGIPR